MSVNEITAKVEELKELENLIEEVKADTDVLRDDIKQEMIQQNTEEMTAGHYIVRFTNVLSNRFDTKRFKENFGEEVYKAYTKQVMSRRFSIA